MTKNNSPRPKRSAVSYEEVAEVCQSLLEQGREPSGRAVHAETGGSLTTIQEFVKRFKAELDKENSVPEAVDAVMQEMGREIVGHIRRENTKQLTVLNDEIDELKEVIKELKDDKHQLLEEMKKIHAINSDKEKSTGEALAVAIDRAERAEANKEKLETALNSEREKRHSAELRVAALEAELAVINKK